MRMTIRYGALGLLLLAGAGCTADLPGVDPGEATRPLTLLTSVEQFAGGAQTRVTVNGRDFLDNDRIRVKLICPYVKSTETGESTSGDTSDGFWLLKRNGGGWTTLTAADKCDLNGDGIYSGSSDLQQQYLAQQTPYVFTASTWSREVRFLDGVSADAMKTVVHYAPVFHADQRLEADFEASDLLWAQSVMQTGTDYVRLNFRHMMALLVVTVEGTTPLSDPVLTLEKMPDIDQQELVVGDFFAEKSKVNGLNGYDDYGYQHRYKCTMAENGTLLGIGTFSRTALVKPLTTLDCDGVYTAYRDGDKKTFRLIVPPYAFTAGYPTLWLRDGAQRWSLQLDPAALTASTAEPEAGTTEAGTLRFESGKCYPVTMKISESSETNRTRNANETRNR